MYTKEDDPRRNRRGGIIAGLLGGAAAGAAVMYLFDPQHGERRRHHLAEMGREAASRTGSTLGTAWETASERGQAIGSRVARTAGDVGSRAWGGASSRYRDWRGELSELAGGEGAIAAIGQWLRGARTRRQALRLGRRIRRRGSELYERARGHAMTERHMGFGEVAAQVGMGLGFLALGALVMYLLDPQRGRTRRSLVRNKAVGAWHKTRDGMSVAGRDLWNRTRGTVSELGSKFRHGDVSDDLLKERIRARMGHIITHPGSIEVKVEAGNVTLSGPIFSHEVDDLISQVTSMRGVHEVANHLEPHETAENVPGLQGEPRRLGRFGRSLPGTWSPATRTLVGVAGGALGFYAVTRRDWLGAGLGLLGLGMLAGGIANPDALRLMPRRWVQQEPQPAPSQSEWSATEAIID